MFIYRILFLIEISIAYEWNTSILQMPPQNITDCSVVEKNNCMTEETIFEFCENSTINVAVILPNTSSIINLMEAESILNKTRENSSYNFEFLYLDDKCKQEFATVSLINSRTAHVIIGPVCDYCLASIGRVAKYIGYGGTPVITPGGFTFDFTKPKTQCSDEFYMTVNTGPADYRSFSEFFRLIVERYKWKKVALMYDKLQRTELGGENSCQLLMSSIVEELKSVPNINYHDGDLQLLQINYTEYLKRIVGVNYGIILTCLDHEHLREFAAAAYEMNMMESGEYTIFNFETYSSASDPSKPWYDPNNTATRNEMVEKAFGSIFTFTPYDEIYYGKNKKPGSIYPDALYDSMLLYAHALNKSLAHSNTITGYDVVQNMMGTSFQGKNDRILMNCNGARVAKYVMLQQSASQYSVVAVYTTLNKTIIEWRVQWKKENGPLDTPICGYDQSLCAKYDTVKILIITLILVLVLGILVVGIILYRHFKLKAAIYSMAWKINYEDILFLPITRRSSFQSSASYNRGSQTTYFEADGLSAAGDRQLYTTVGFYKAIRVAVKFLQDVKIEPTHNQLTELKVMKDLSNDNLLKFYGACVDVPNCILSEYCPKGSLQDILENDNVKLDAAFKMSLIMDIVRGMSYLHNSIIKSHGALKSSNCLVDSRFVLKIADFGLHFLRKHSNDTDTETHRYWERQLWTAPEILRMKSPPPEGSQKGDVYSFAIIMHEIIARQGVFHLDEYITAKEKVDAVRKGPEGNGGYPLRPSLGEIICEEEVELMMKKCWSEESADRPDFSFLKNKLKHINKETDGNLLDNLLARMEQYANNLESLVEERTADYLEEKRKCEELLYQLLPKSVAQQLITGESVIAETFEFVTIHFSDIVGFTALCADSTPLQVVKFLNDLYTCFDSIIEHFDVYKVETIGDSYMVVSGLPVRNGNKHAREIARMSLALLNAVKPFKIRHRPEQRLQLRIGIHTGACVAGVVGLKMPRYCLFGDTVNTASRMETNGLPLRVHISPATKEFLDMFGTFDVERRGEVELKGKGKMVTYWLNGEHEQTSTTLSPQLEVKSKAPSGVMPNNAKKPMANNDKALSQMDFQDQIDEAGVPLLSITSPPEYSSNA